MRAKYDILIPTDISKSWRRRAFFWRPDSTERTKILSGNAGWQERGNRWTRGTSRGGLGKFAVVVGSFGDSEIIITSILEVSEDQAKTSGFMHGAGCPKCGESGFRGRKGVFEIFVVNQEIEEMIYNNVSIVELRKKAREMGMRSMREDGFRKVLAGVTTLEEVLMVTTAEE